ncbi:MAG: DUF2063 domain-containing protein [Gammaproteobacteria bacterium]|nr:DUF2063 domain-containing protein [Gammaproteobacteria bacterium]
MLDTAKTPNFKQLQYRFTAHVRNPDKFPRPPDIEARHMQIYNELFFNNVESFMSSGFPVLRSIMPNEQWTRLIRDYFETHMASTPLFPQMTREFLRYLEHERITQADDFPFMLELAHYEWAELALSISEQKIDVHGIETNGDLLGGVPVLSPLAWILSYDYPVHQICSDFLPEQPPKQPTDLIVYRDRHDEVHFLQINPVAAQLLALIQADVKQTTRQMLNAIAAQLQHMNPEMVIQGGLQILHDLKCRDVILGVTTT